jgi:DNA ligase-1
VGTTITFRYQELSDGGVPRFPSYVGVRSDEPTASQLPFRAEEPPQRARKAATASLAKTLPAAPQPAKTPKADTSGRSRRFEFVGGSSAKFWEVSWSGCELTTRWGRIGSDGQSKTKSFADEAAAARAGERLIADKTGEGYVEK